MSNRRLMTAAQLGITEEELKALKMVRHSLNCGILSEERFDMRVIFSRSSECGTVGCIGGWMAVCMGRAHPDLFIGRDCSDSLGPLFYPWKKNREGFEIHDATPAQAVRAIDNFLATGEPDWERVMA